MYFLIELFFLVESKLVSSSEEHSPSLITTLFLYTIKNQNLEILLSHKLVIYVSKKSQSGTRYA